MSSSLSSTDTAHSDFHTRLAHLLRARFPLLYLSTREEERACQIVSHVATDPARMTTPRMVYTWTLLEGLCCPGLPCHAQTTDPLAALEAMAAFTQPVVCIILDVAAFLGPADSLQQHSVLRKLKTLSSHLRYEAIAKTLVFIDADPAPPAALQHETHTIDLALPGYGEMRTLLDEMMAEHQNKRGIRLELDAAGREKMAQAALGLTLQEAENAFAYAMVTDGRLSTQDLATILAEKTRILKQSEALEFVDATLPLAEVGGLETVKTWLGKRRNAWLGDARRYHLPNPKGILVTGAPGCGKSLLVKAIGSYWELPLLRLDPGALFSAYIGSSESNLRKALKTVEAIAPCVLWIDEIEKSMQFNNSAGDSGVSSRIFGALLTWMQENQRPVFVAATANHVERIPPELLRKGRFDEIFFVDLPHLAERTHILSVHLRRRLTPQNSAFVPDSAWLSAMAQRMEGFSGAEIETVVVNGLFEAYSHSRLLSASDLEQALSAITPFSVLNPAYMQTIRAWAGASALSASAPGAATGEAL